MWVVVLFRDWCLGLPLFFLSGKGVVAVIMSQFAFSVGRWVHKNSGDQPTPSPPIKVINLRVFTYCYPPLLRTTSIMLSYFMDMHRVSTGICKETARRTEKRQTLPTRLWITRWFSARSGGGECMRGGWCISKVA